MTIAHGVCDLWLTCIHRLRTQIGLKGDKISETMVYGYTRGGNLEL